MISECGYLITSDHLGTVKLKKLCLYIYYILEANAKTCTILTTRMMQEEVGLIAFPSCIHTLFLTVEHLVILVLLIHSYIYI